jgi:acetyltransferase-like isoleucine patch superfamily enzyme
MIRLILKLIKNCVFNIFYDFKKSYLLARTQVENPKSKLYEGAFVYKSSLGKFNVIFNKTNIVSCAIGSHTYVQKNSTIINAKIGKYCSIAPNVNIGPGIHKTNGVSTHPAFFLKNTPLLKTYSSKDAFESSKLVEIGNDVWIGQNALILDGIKIGNGAIIAAGAIVTKNVEPYSIVGGVPAKHIKYRFDDLTISILEKSEWWNYPEEWFEKNGSIMRNSSEFIAYLKCL